MRYLPGRRVLVTGLMLILVALLGCVLMVPGAARAAAAATTRPHAATTAASFFPAAVTAPASQAPPGRRARLAGPAAVFAPEAATAGDTAAARGGVYTLRDAAGNVVRTGRSVNLAARQVAHANDPVLGEFEFQVEYRTNVYAEQRGLEQILYDRYPGAQAANGGYNMIRGISPLNPRGPGYMQAAYDFLGRLEGGD
ncbi:MAG: hypothetical protein ACYCO9_14210 [Streptosporangiaceae bacterium]